jgi:hypothetical protein
MPLPLGFIPPCLPTKAPRPPTGAAWLHEIKHDGFRVIVRKDGTRIKLYSRAVNDLTDRFTLIVEALAGLRWRSVSSTARPCAATMISGPAGCGGRQGYNVHFDDRCTAEISVAPLGP